MFESRGDSLKGSATRLVARFAVLSLAVTTPGAVGAVEVTTRPGYTPAPANLRIVDGDIHLTLQEAVLLAIERNLAVHAQQYAHERANLGIQEAMGIYDFNLLAGAEMAEDESPAASNLDGALIQKTERTSLYVGGSQLVPTGGLFTVNFPNSRFETNSDFAFVNPSFNSALDLTFQQPLLRNFGRDATEYAIDVAKATTDISDADFEAQLVLVVQRVSNAYWTLVAARSALDVAQESLGLAKELDQNNRVRVDVGTLAPLELVQSEAGIAAREEDIIRARAAIGDAEDLLFFFLNIEQGDAWSRQIVPDTPELLEREVFPLDESIRKALAERPEMHGQDVRLHVLALDQAFFHQATKPRLDLRASYGLSGLGGDVLIRDADGNVIGTLDGGWNDAFDQVTGWDFPGWAIGVELGWPIQNRTAKARAAMADLALEEERLAGNELELQITTEVRAAVRGIATAKEQLESAEVSQRLAEKNLDAERKKYDNGLSTSFQILEVQEDLTTARERVVAGQTAYRRALIEYHRATGTLLDRAEIQIVE